MCSNLILGGLYFFIAEGTAMVAMQISKISYKNWAQVIKKRTKCSTKKMRLGLDFLVAMDTAMVAVEILKISCNIASIKKY